MSNERSETRHAQFVRGVDDVPERVVRDALKHIAGGTIMNILRHELPDTDRSGDVVAFATAATVYGALLLSLSPAG